MVSIRLILLLAVLCSTMDTLATPKPPTPPIAQPFKSDNHWYSNAQKHLRKNIKLSQDRPAKPGAAKNIILFVGDGMGVSTVTASRILEGQLQGQPGEENLLSFEHFPYTAIAKTYNVDAQTPDSAGTMTALMTGVKTNAGVIGMSAIDGLAGCNQLRSKELISGLELAEIAGKSTGVVSTARLTHATPAATYAKAPSRQWESTNQIPPLLREQGCEGIAEQLVYFKQRTESRYPGINIDGIDVALGGGRHLFTASATADKKERPKNLIDAWQKNYPKGVFVEDRQGLLSLDVSSTKHVFGLFSDSHMSYESNREDTTEPSLSEMTIAAIELLKRNPNGYFLMVEAGRIDHAHHQGNAFNALMETIEFARAIELAMKHIDLEETLVIATADHSHVFTIAGYPKRGNPILGKVVGVNSKKQSLAADGKPYTTLGYMNGPGHQHAEVAAEDGRVTKERVDLSEIDTTEPGYQQYAGIAMNSETHGGEDVVVYGVGPGAHLLHGTIEQNTVFHVMDYAADLTGLAQRRMNLPQRRP